MCLDTAIWDPGVDDSSRLGECTGVVYATCSYRDIVMSVSQGEMASM
jgi:hypothetical protein